MVTCSRSPSQNGSIISNESGKPSSSRSSPQKVVAPPKVTKDEGRKRNGEKCLLLKAARSRPVVVPTCVTAIFLYLQLSFRRFLLAAVFTPFAAYSYSSLSHEAVRCLLLVHGPLQVFCDCLFIYLFIYS